VSNIQSHSAKHEPNFLQVPRIARNGALGDARAKRKCSNNITVVIAA